MKKDRGKFLTVMIVLAAFGYMQTVYYLTNTNIVQQAYGAVPSWFQAYSLIGLLLGIIIIYGIWMWKRWAVYLLAASTVISFLMQLFILKPVQAGQLTYYMTMVSAGLWFWALYRKWKNFA